MSQICDKNKKIIFEESVLILGVVTKIITFTIITI